MMLIETLIALMIFAMGILAVIGMQARSIGETMDARYRVDASFLANQILSQMWADRANLAGYACNPCKSASGGNTVTQAWVSQIQSTTSQSAYLPGVTDTANQPSINVNTSNNQVTVTLQWKSPQGGGVHNYTTMAQING
jgi:type IV pilus assembly protein PilV